jgi:hypothetical protein
MSLIIVLDLLSIVSLVLVALTKGFERTLPWAAFLLVLFPEESKIPLPGFFDLTTQRVITIVLIILCLFAKKAGASPKLPLRTGIALLAGWWILSAANSVVFAVSFKTVLSQILDYLVIFWIFATYISKRETVERILFGMVSGVIVCSFFGVLEAYARWTVMSLFPATLHRFGVSGDLYMDVERGIRVQSTFPHPILLGSALAMTIPIALYLVSVSQKMTKRIFLWTGILLMFACIYKAASRGPWLALSLSLALLMIAEQKTLRKYVVVVVLFALTVVILRPGVWDTIQNMYSATLDDKSVAGDSYQYRYALYGLAVRELDRGFPRALWGYGPESFFFLGLTGNFNGRNMVFTSCDSSMAAFLIETGYIGFLIIMLLLLSALTTTLRAYRKLPSPANRLCIVLFVNLGAFCFMMANVAIFRWGQQAIMFWIIMALAMLYPYLLNPNEQPAAAQTVPNPLPELAWVRSRS